MAQVTSYTVDDGTGTIACKCWLNNEAAQAQTAGATTSNSSSSSSSGSARKPAAADDMDDDFWEAADTDATPLQMGDLARFRGKFQLYQGRRQMSVESWRLETDPNAETLHWLEVIQLTAMCTPSRAPLLLTPPRNSSCNSS